MLGILYAETKYIEIQEPYIEDIEGIIRGFDAEELILFNQELDVDPQQLLVEIQNPNQVENEIVPNTSNTSNNYDALILFILGTLALFLIARYGSSLLEYLFDIARDIPGAVDRSIAGIIRRAAEEGNLEVIYRFTIRRAHTVVNDPDTANRFFRGVQQIHALRNQ